MSSNRYAVLSLLAREPLSGYDIKQHMNNRLGPFWKVGSNQIYPELAKMEAEGLIRLQTVEQLSYRPARKLYEITDTGCDLLKTWVLEPGGVDQSRDDFFLKAYNSWLVEPAQMAAQFLHIQKQHEEKLAAYSAKVKEFRQIPGFDQPDHPFFSTIAVAEFGIQYEQLYIAWCEEQLEKLRGAKPGS